MFPIIIPKAVHICHIMTRAPRIGAGEHSAAYTGVVVDFEPIPSPRTKRARKRLTHEFATPSQIDATAAMAQDMKIVPRLPNKVLRGSVSQHPRIAQARYGAPTMSPVRLSTLFWENLSVVILNRWSTLLVWLDLDQAHFKIEGYFKIECLSSIVDSLVHSLHSSTHRAHN